MTSKNEKMAEDRTDWAEDRTILANERTFAGWMRTGLASVGIGLAVEAIFKEVEPTWMAKLAATIFILIGISIFYAAYDSSCKTFERLSSHRSEPIKSNKMRWIVTAFITGAIAVGVVLWMI